jgi:hypothetical protein
MLQVRSRERRNDYERSAPGFQTVNPILDLGVGGTARASTAHRWTGKVGIALLPWTYAERLALEIALNQADEIMIRPKRS